MDDEPGIKIMEDCFGENGRQLLVRVEWIAIWKSEHVLLGQCFIIRKVLWQTM